MHKLVIVDLGPNKADIWLDGFKLEGVRSVEVLSPMSEATTVKLELVVQSVGGGPTAPKTTEVTDAA